MPDLIGQTWWITPLIAVLAILLFIVLLLYIMRTKSRVSELGLPGGFKIVLQHKDASAPAVTATATPPAIPHVFEKSDAGAFTVCAETLLRDARKVILIGTGLNLLQKDSIFLDVAERAARGDCTVEVYMANPWSPDVITRLVEEELGPVKPPVGPGGLRARLTTILHKLRDLGWPAHFSLNLFWNYPTFALCILDGHYFTYPYGFEVLGNVSPVEHFTRDAKEHAPMIEFFDRQYARVKQASVPARLVFAAHGSEERVAPEQLRAFAVYLVPPADSPLYRFVTEVLGYDVRRGKHIDTDWSEEVGGAALFGAHVTVADALYFTSRSEIDRVEKELELRLADFPRFTLRLKLQPDFPDERSLSLLCEDESGMLAALHHEMVATVYRWAVASNYTLGLGGRRYDARADPLLDRYRAPYVLGRYRPHITLLTNVAPSRMPAAAAALRGHPDELPVSHVALMSQPSPGAPWQIDRELPLR